MIVRPIRPPRPLAAAPIRRPRRSEGGWARTPRAVAAMVAGVPLVAGLTSANAPVDLSEARAVAAAPLPARSPAAPPLAPVPDPDAPAPIVAAAPLIASAGDGVSLGRALDCLTAAIYYEAGAEAADGQRAVAQVVLNRVRHVAYPASVCGVVFEGARLPTGCQFTFTCDGSLARVPSEPGWRRARAIAAAALAGYVHEPVGLATHYHADYVSPHWAPKLVHLTTVGPHIFYRMPGGTGAPGAYRTRYAGRETISAEQEMAEARAAAAAAASAEPIALASAADGEAPADPATSPVEETLAPVRSARPRPLRLAARPAVEVPKSPGVPDTAPAVAQADPAGASEAGAI